MEKSYPVIGRSMLFLLEPGDAAVAKPCRPDGLRSGEIALLVKWADGRPDGYVIHRVLLNLVLGRFRLLLTRGDANFFPDLPPSAFQPAAKITAISREGRVWSAEPGPAWPLVSAFSFAGVKLLSWTVYAVFFLFSAAAFCLPRFFGAILNTLYLYWEDRLYPAALRLFLSIVRPMACQGGPAGGSGSVKSGRIRLDETWSGKITVADYLVIERGVSVTVLPGSEITFTRREPWFFPVIRAGDDGTRRQLDSGLAKALVYGGFSAGGSKDAPVIIRGGSFGGIHALGFGRISARNCLVEGAGSSALSAWDNGLVDLEEVSFSSCRMGVEVSGQGAALLEKCVFSGSTGPAARVLDKACLVFSRGKIKGAPGTAFEISGTARAAFYGTAIIDSVCGLSVSGRSAVRMDDCLFSGNSGQIISLGSWSSFSARRCVFEKSAAGISAAGHSRVALRECSFSGNTGPGVKLSGRDTLEASGCVFENGESGIEGSGLNRVEISSSSFSGVRGPAVRLIRPVSLSAADSVFSGNAVGMSLEASPFPWNRSRFLIRNCIFEKNTGPAFCAFGRNETRMDDCRFSGNSGQAVSLAGRASFSARRCVFENGESGIEGGGLNRVEIRSSSFSGIRGHAVRVERLVSLSAADSVFRGNAAGISLEASPFPWNYSRLVIGNCVFEENTGPALCSSGRGRADLSRSVFRGNSVGADFSGEVSALAAGCAFENQRGAPLLCSGRAVVRLENSTFTDNISGAAFSGLSRGEARACRFDRNAGPSFELSDGAELSAAECSFSGVPASLLLAGRSRASVSRSMADSSGGPAVSLDGLAFFHAARSEFKSGSDAVFARGRSSITLEACSLFSDSGAALNLSMARAVLRSVSATGAGGLLASFPSEVRAKKLEIRARDYAVNCSGVRLRVSGLRASGGARGGVHISGGSARFDGAVLSGSPHPGLSAEGGALLSCRNVVFEGVPWRPPGSSAETYTARAALFRFSAATARLPVFSSFYRLIYLAAARAAGVFLRPRGRGSLYLYRGMAAPGWVPALSDMDLALVLERRTPAEDWFSYKSLRRRLRAFRAVFPFTGEILTAPEKHFSYFMSSWGVKGAEFPAASRLLAGPGISSRPPGGGRAADQTEAFYAYTLLLRHFFAEEMPPSFRLRNCLKNMVDVKRYLDFSSPLRASRSAYAAGLGLDLEGVSAFDLSEAAFESFRALHAASPAAGPGTGPADAPPGGWFNRRAFEAAGASLSEAAGRGSGVVLDPLYRVYLVLPDEVYGDKAAFLRAASALRAASLAASCFSAAPLLLTRSAFRGLSRLPYLNNPLFWLDLARPAAGVSPEDGGIYSSGAEVPPPPASSELKTCAALAAGHFSASWRGLWGEMPPHYFYTRAAGLRLLIEKGSSPPFSRPAELSESFRAAFGDSFPDWRAYLAGGAGRGNYEFIAAQTTALMEAVDGG
ncbi:MAG: hypothetical protein A2X39_08980 [Elusimicrobia bacterium GWC2_56_31]|nr:MAG: hypothetical protein A2X39_08980 [Elusimicrobia bacterium GWC2_56_31]HBW21781.1 hypothetical protein [Elusimicrobiota bacterium]